MTNSMTRSVGQESFIQVKGQAEPASSQWPWKETRGEVKPITMVVETGG